MSTVDSADTSAGAVAVALALVEQIGGRSGDYGELTGHPPRCPASADRDVGARRLLA
jgi:hypothetical protein